MNYTTNPMMAGDCRKNGKIKYAVETKRTIW